MAFVISRQSTTGLLILTDTDTGKIVSRAETPWDLVNLAVQKGAVPENQRQELISQGQAFVQSEDSKQAQQNTTQSAGEQVNQSGDAGVTNPAQPPQTFTSPDNTVTTAQTEPVVATANKDTPSIGQSSNPSPDATAATVQTNAEEAVGQEKSQPEIVVTADRQGNERATKQSYVFYATRVTSEFRQGRFEQTLEGALYIFPRPQKSQIVDPPAVVTSAELGSQSFGLTDSRVNPGKKKVASPQDVRKAAIASQTFPLNGVSQGAQLRDQYPNVDDALGGGLGG